MQNRYQTLDLNNKLIWNFRDISHTMRQSYEGKGSQKRILIILLETGGMTQRELTRRLGIQPGSVSEVIGKLEAAQFVVRTPSAADRRTTEIQLTEAGRAAAEKAFAQRTARHDQMFSCFSAEEKDTLLSLLEKLNAAWGQQYGETDPTATDDRKGNGKQNCR